MSEEYLNAVLSNSMFCYSLLCCYSASFRCFYYNDFFLEGGGVLIFLEKV